VASKKKAVRKKKAARKKKPAPPSWKLRLGCWSLGVLLGLIGGGAGVFWVLEQAALAEVDARLSGAVWASNGRVLSAPMELWPGLEISAADVVEDLRAAGHGRVSEITEIGDFMVRDQDILIRTADGDVHLAFDERRLVAVAPVERVRLAPRLLASLQGPDGEAREPVGLDDVPDALEQAVLAMEDARFFEHRGIDPLGIARAVITNVVKGRPVQGGSTLTQQVVKNVFLTQEKTLERKFKEAILALALERSRSKEEILELYLNEIYLGQVGGVAVCGVAEAARVYFGKPIGRIGVGEAATLAGIVSAPNRYSPSRHPERALERRDITLRRMEAVGFLAPGEAARHAAQPLQVAPTPDGRWAPWMVDAALDRVESIHGQGSVAARGLVVHTTLQPGLQRLAERVVGASLLELQAKHPGAKGAEMALVAMRATDGAVVAMVGGRSYRDSAFNRALHGSRQVGSTVKPLNAMLAFEANLELSPGSVVLDEARSFDVDGEVWEPQNHDREFHGQMSLRDAVAQSRNLPAVILAEEVGFATLAGGLQRAGLDRAHGLPSMSLGAFDASPMALAGAYTAIPGAGLVAQAHWVVAVEEGEVRTSTQGSGRTRLVGPRAAFLAEELLREVVATGTGRRAVSLGAPPGVGGKTGTTDGGRDAWFAGHVGELVVVVWVGQDKGTALGLGGATAALPAWSRFVGGTGLKPTPAQAPEGLVQVDICAESLEPAAEACPEIEGEWFGADQVPEERCHIHGGFLEQLEARTQGILELLRRRLRFKPD
jgi:penicillin-binding protein 1B